MNIYVKILSEILTNQIQQYIEGIIWPSRAYPKNVKLS